MCGIDIDFAQGTPVETIAYNWFKNGVSGCVLMRFWSKADEALKRRKKINEKQLSEAAKSSAFQLDKFFKVSSNTR